MIKMIEFWLNIVHYCLYKVDYKLHLLSNKLNPFLLIGRIPVVKRKFEEQGTSQKEVVNKVWGDKHYGLGMIIAGGGVIVVLFFLMWAFLSCFLGLMGIYFLVKPEYIFSYALLSFLICHFFIFHKDKYIEYFKKFDKWSAKEKWKYGLLTLFIIVGSTALWIYSFRFLPKSL